MSYFTSKNNNRFFGKQFYLFTNDENYEYLVDDLQFLVRNINGLTSSIIDEDTEIISTLRILTNSVFLSILIPTGTGGGYLQGVQLDESSNINIANTSRLGIIRLTGSNLVSSTGDQTDFTVINGENIIINNILNISDIINISNNVIETVTGDFNITVNNGDDIRFVGDVEITGTIPNPRSCYYCLSC